VLGSIPSGPTEKPLRNEGLFLFDSLVFKRGFLVRVRAIFNLLRETKLTSKVKISFTFYQKIARFGADRDAVLGCNLIKTEISAFVELIDNQLFS
jgi:hypothetical protein